MPLLAHGVVENSTVINLLKNAPQHGNDKSDELAIFVFDAWAHEGDPLRRTFLEKLIAFLTNRGWVNPNKWDKKLKELSRVS